MPCRSFAGKRRGIRQRVQADGSGRSNISDGLSLGYQKVHLTSELLKKVLLTCLIKVIMASWLRSIGP